MTAAIPDLDQPTCGTCHRKQPTPTVVCDTCRSKATTHLDDLPDLLTRLQPALQPASGGLVEYVSGGAFTSTPPLAVDPLNLLAATPAAIGAAATNPTPPGRDTPPMLWIIGWAGTWRRRQGHHTPAPARTQPASERRRDPAGLRQLLGYTPAAAVKPTTHPDSDKGVEYEPGVWLDRPPAADHDPAEHAWFLRHGTPTPPHRLTTDLNYLRAWLTHAADHFDDTPTFCRDLRHHVTAIRTLLGETTGRTYLGRCPEPVYDGHGDPVHTVTYTDAGTEVWEPARCGAPLYRDPNHTPLLVQCRACSTKTPERGLLNLALRMRTVWGADETTREAWTR